MDLKSNLPNISMKKYISYYDENITVNSILSFSIVLENISDKDLKYVEVVEDLPKEVMYIEDSLKINNIDPFEGDINLNETNIIPIGIIRAKSNYYKTNSIIVITFDTQVVGVSSDETISTYSSARYSYYDDLKVEEINEMCSSNIVTLTCKATSPLFKPKNEEYIPPTNYLDIDKEYVDALSNFNDNIDDNIDSYSIIENEYIDNNDDLDIDKGYVENIDDLNIDSDYIKTIDNSSIDDEPVNSAIAIKDKLELKQFVSPEYPFPGQPLLYSLYIKNTSSEPLQGVIIQSTIPSGTSLVLSSVTLNLAPYKLDNNIITEDHLERGININTISPNESATVQYQLTLNRRIYRKPITNTINLYSSINEVNSEILSSTSVTTISNINAYTSSNTYSDSSENVDGFDSVSKRKTTKVSKSFSSKQFRRGSKMRRSNN